MTVPAYHQKIMAILDSQNYIMASKANPVACNYIVRLYHTNEVTMLDRGDLFRSASLRFGVHALRDAIDSLILHSILSPVADAPEKVFRKAYLTRDTLRINSPQVITRWTSFSDHAPLQDGDILIAFGSGGVLQVEFRLATSKNLRYIFISGSGLEYFLGGADGDNDDITHWMPLPPHPSKA